MTHIAVNISIVLAYLLHYALRETVCDWLIKYQIFKCVIQLFSLLIPNMKVTITTILT